ncbi:uncharacterized protein N7506_008418 [Penicillium brevicompactum]|uniref:uncharacterized protein n=1 Tax=Penicillium brevicompactum TaxID=5074 RepID=UPI00253FA09C|nr:uncharacterized protein N7506_008418 [Penicillium brevicompactum]KAJ5325316.1 hypothetical protein N7506_008418 [Penicillium brevicompactum]
MLGVAGKIPGSPWATLGLGPYLGFDSFWKYREGIQAEDEADFQADCRRMKRDALKTAHIVIGTPAGITDPSILTCLHPSFVAVDEASMIQCMSTAGFMATFFTHQRRMTGDIHSLSSDLFYGDKEMKSDAPDPDNKARSLALWNQEQHSVHSNALMLDIPWTSESCIGTSFENPGNREVVLGLVRKIVGDGLFEAKDIVVLVGYEAQWRQYVKDLRALAETDPSVPWGNVRATKIDAMQGNEANIIIFDYVRTAKQHEFMKSFRRLNVACSRGRFGFYLVASAASLNGRGRDGLKAPGKLYKWFETRKAIVTVNTPAHVTAIDDDN